jgi:hypothetical protein
MSEETNYQLSNQSKSSMSDVKSCNEWRERVSNIQRQKMTPEALQSLKEKAERQKRATRAFKTAEIMERCDKVSRKAQETSLKRTYFLSSNSARGEEDHHDFLGHQQMFGATLSAPPQMMRSNESEYMRVAERNYAQTSSVRSVLNSRRATSAQMSALPPMPMAAPTSAVFGAAPPLPRIDDEEEERNYAALSAQLDAVEADVDQDDVETTHMMVNAAQPVSTFGVMNVPAAPAPSGFEGLLETLAVEPTDPNEVTTKFAIFENYLETVVTLREQTIEFWQTNRSQFEEEASLRSVVANMDRAIRNIDQESSMTIQEGGFATRWFVYYMMKKANQNHEAISNTLKNIRSKLEMLTQEDIDCPFCLESVGRKDSDAVVLGCCHKTCKPCWANWQELKGMNAFCPLCRHEEFIQSIVVDNDDA